MDKDPIREVEVIQYNNKIYKKALITDLPYGHIEKIVVDDYKVKDLEKELTALRSHNLELVEALKDAHQKSRDIYSELVMSNNPRCDQWSSPAVILKQQESKLHQALSSPPSEKYLKMVRDSFEDAKRIAELRETFKHYHQAGTLKGLDIDTCAKCGLDIRDTIHIRSYEALKSYNSEKGGE